MPDITTFGFVTDYIYMTGWSQIHGVLENKMSSRKEGDNCLSDQLGLGFLAGAGAVAGMTLFWPGPGSERSGISAGAGIIKKR